MPLPWRGPDWLQVSLCLKQKGFFYIMCTFSAGKMHMMYLLLLLVEDGFNFLECLFHRAVAIHFDK